MTCSSTAQDDQQVLVTNINVMTNNQQHLLVRSTWPCIFGKSAMCSLWLQEQASSLAVCLDITC